MPRKTLKTKEKKKEDKVVKGNIHARKKTEPKKVKVPVNVVNLKKDFENVSTASSGSVEKELESKKQEARKRIEKENNAVQDSFKPEKDPRIEQYFQYAREEKKKRMIMYLSISSIMLVIAVLWFFNFRYNLQQASLAREMNASEKYDIDKISEDFKKTMEAMSAELAKQQTIATTTSNGLTASSSEANIDIAGLKAKLEAKATSTSTPEVLKGRLEAADSATSTK